GPQQCVRECRHRPKLCRGVNYRNQELLCELVSTINETEPNSDYVRIELGQEIVNTECLSCSIDELCVMLSSKQFHCIKEGNAATGPKDCTYIYNSNTQSPSGHYQVWLRNLGHVTVYCDMVTDGGGWTVFQRRHDGSQDFNRTWIEYKNGFGNMSLEFWLGNEKLHYLLSQGTNEMRMDMKDFTNEKRYVKYSSFNVGNEFSNYTVTLSGFSGDVDDCFTGTAMPINNMMFTTQDRDNDMFAENCAELSASGWWHNNCNCANPNGLYLSGETALHDKGIIYGPWLGFSYSLKFTELKVRRLV
uniref:Fibrinogen C-terminal domain-containing protein n=1 Tax=Magallana gigas TaxID=29159 RepID=A0A8W8P6N4_MAGGI